MKNLRNLLRTQARSMKWEYAVVEQIYRGVATVILNDSSRRLTNLTVIGEEIEIGDTVVVDYSSEIPCVRRIKQGIVEDELPFAGVATLAGGNEIVRTDIGFAVTTTYYYVSQEEMPYCWPGQRFLMPFGLNDWPYYMDYWESAVQWDSGQNIIGTTEFTFLGRTHVTIKTSARYYIRIYWNSGFPYGDTTDLPYGGQWTRVLKNYTTPLLEINQRHGFGYYTTYDRPGMSGLTIANLTAGDKLSLEFKFDRTDLSSIRDNEWVFGYDDSDFEWLSLTVQLIAGTES